MNVIAKQAAAGRLRKAMEFEKLSTNQTASCLGLNPQYVSMFLNEKLWPKCPTYAFERLIAWCNSGSTLKRWKIPEGMSIWKPKKAETPAADFVQTNIAGENLKTEIIWIEQADSMMTPDEAEKVNRDMGKHITLKPGEEVEFRRDLKDEHQDSPVKTGEYLNLIEAIKLVAEKLPGNVSIEIRINPVMAGKEKS